MCVRDLAMSVSKTKSIYSILRLHHQHLNGIVRTICLLATNLDTKHTTGRRAATILTNEEFKYIYIYIVQRGWGYIVRNYDI